MILLSIIKEVRRVVNIHIDYIELQSMTFKVRTEILSKKGGEHTLSPLDKTANLAEPGPVSLLQAYDPYAEPREQDGNHHQSKYLAWQEAHVADRDEEHDDHADSQCYPSCQIGVLGC
jgi:hypothetical protein